MGKKFPWGSWEKLIQCSKILRIRSLWRFLSSIIPERVLFNISGWCISTHMCLRRGESPMGKERLWWERKIWFGLDCLFYCLFSWYVQLPGWGPLFQKVHDNFEVPLNRALTFWRLFCIVLRSLQLGSRIQFRQVSVLFEDFLPMGRPCRGVPRDGRGFIELPVFSSLENSYTLSSTS